MPDTWEKITTTEDGQTLFIGAVLKTAIDGQEIARGARPHVAVCVGQEQIVLMARCAREMGQRMIELADKAVEINNDRRDV